MRKDKDCPYKRFCNDSCSECDYHEVFEAYRNKVERLKRKVAKLEGQLAAAEPEKSMKRPVELIIGGCRAVADLDDIVATPDYVTSRINESIERLQSTTFGDTIRAMPDEQLAVFLATWAEKDNVWRQDAGEVLAHLQSTIKEGCICIG